MRSWPNRGCCDMENNDDDYNKDDYYKTDLQNVSHENEVDIDNKLNNYLKITSTINSTFRPQKTLKKTRVKLYNTLGLPASLYGSEN
jgi:hypothetical protein